MSSEQPAGGKRSANARNQVPLVIQRPGVVGVHADEVLMSKTDARISLTFVQVYDVSEAEIRGQVASMVYMSPDKARDMVRVLRGLLAAE